jgi:S-DNA-T family DNA segregation ATPase FtsK/SpoIIIE
MAEKKNTESMPKNTFRNKTIEPEPIEEPVKKLPPKKEKKAKATSDSTESTGFWNGLKAFLKSEQTHKVTGLLLIAFSIALIASFISYFFHWKEDQTMVHGGIPGESPNNIMGKLGVSLAHFFIHRWFGVSSFLLTPIFFFIGLRLLYNFQRIHLLRISAILFFLTIWISGVFAYTLPNVGNGMLGGKFGENLIVLMNTNAGIVGSGLIFLFSFLIFLVVAFNSSLKLPSFSFGKKKPLEEVSVSAEEDTNIATPVNVYTHRNQFINDEPTEVEEEEEEENIPLDELPELEVKEIDEENETSTDELEIIQQQSPEDELELTVTNPVEESTTPKTTSSENLVATYGEYDSKLDLPHYKIPPLDLLVDYGDQEISINKEELEENKNRIIETLRNYNIDIAKIKATVGPTVTLYEIVPAAGVRISKIKNLEDDIALSLAALGIRIIAPIPGKGTIGIEVPNQNPQVVSMFSVLKNEKFANSKFDLPVGLGKTISNEVFIADLAKMPHLLMAGATGQGKSVGLNAILVSLLYKKHPSQIKFVMIDPKKVELTLYNLIEKHFLAKLPGEEKAIITDTKKAQNTLNSLCIEMDNRYALLENAQVRQLKEYNEKFVNRKLNPLDGHRFLPYIVVVIDEFADLIMTAGKEVEMPIARIAQLARAVGIHLIIATQRPSVNIITGTIKANFPARIAFRVTSKIDSRTILDAGGAEQLIGRGDMLLSTGSDLIRLQCPFVDTPEVEKIARFIGEQQGYPEAMKLPEYIGEEGDADKTKFEINELDELFEEAARIIVQHQQGSASLLQRRLNLGYNRAGRLIDQMESAGIVGPNKGSKAREVLISDEFALEQYLKDLR